MSTFTKFLSAAALALTVPLAADAATLKTITFDYGNGVDERNPLGDDPVSPDYVLIRDNTANEFKEFFDFTNLAGATYDSFELSLTYTAVTTSTEDWFVRILGSGASNFAAGTEINVDLVDQTVGSTITQTITIDAASDVGTIDAFATAAADNMMQIRFREETNLVDVFRLHEAQLVINGTLAPVPLPASGLLLLGAVGGAVALKRRRKAA